MQKNIEVGSIWFDKRGKIPVIVLWSDKEEQRVSFEYLLVIDGKSDLTMANSGVDFFLKTKEPMVTLSHSNKEYAKGKTEGYDEGYQHGYVIAKGKIADELDEEESKKIYNDGYNDGYIDGNNDCSEGLHGHMSERELEVRKQWHEEGYDEGFDDGFNTAIKEISNGQVLGDKTKCDFGSENFCEHHNPSKETQEAMQEVLDRESNKFESIVNGDEQLEKELELVEKYPHYYKDIRHLNIIDIYRFFDLFGVTDPCIQHSVKKLAVGGKRGSKDYEKDIKEAMDTLNRWEYMQEENKRGLDD